MDKLSQDQSKGTEQKRKALLDKGEVEVRQKSVSHTDMIYHITDVPRIHTGLILGLQHFLTMFFATVVIPLIVSNALCMSDNPAVTLELFGVTFFTSGVCSIIQVLLGVRLPIIQGSTFCLMIPLLSYLHLPKNTCPNIQQTCGSTNSTNNTDCIERNSPEYDLIWKSRFVTIQGSIMTASVVEIVLGLTGVVGFLFQYIGPLTICPTITLIGVSLFTPAADFAEQNWPVCFMTLAILILFSQYMSSVPLPLPTYSREKGCSFSQVPIFRSFPIILAILVSWFICFLLTCTNAIPADSKHWAYRARTDISANMLFDSPWFNFFWPGKYGTPKISVSLVTGLVVGLLISVIESTGDYYACARMCGVPNPPKHALNRGIFIEGLGCFVTGLLGTAGGTTSYSQNVGVIGLTKVASRAVVLYCAGIMIFVGIFNKFGVLFVTIPSPVVGATFFVLFGMIVAVGLSNLQFVDLNSSRNQFILGFSLFMGITISEWTKAHTDIIKTGVGMVDELIIILLSTSMFVGGGLAFLFDNTLPGRRSSYTMDGNSEINEDIEFANRELLKVYDFPIWARRVTKLKIFTCLPICPVYLNNTETLHT